MKKYSIPSALVIIVCLCGFAPANWVVFEKKNKGFKISFPKKPQEKEEKTDSEVGSLIVYGAICEMSGGSDDNEVYLLGYTDYPKTLLNDQLPDSVKDNGFKTGIADFATAVEGRVTEVKQTTFKTFPGRDVTVVSEKDDAIFHLRAYMIHSRVYILGVGCTRGHDGNPSIEKFFQSFALTR